MKRPCVYLVGAGPGDPGLISVRGHRCLAVADVVVYDHLVQERLLRAARPEAERIDVGAASPQPLEQEAISYLLADKAREGLLVVRLKWGDPFVFDDGGKEALYLKEQGIPFEVVPGIPAAVGAPAYAGVPITYPDAGDLLIFVRGHESEGDTPPRVDWDKVAGVDGTVVCYAGSRQLAGILDALIARGRQDESAVLIYNGTLPSQHIEAGTLGELALTVRTKPHRVPAILVVGAVAGMREHLRWFDVRPLFGKRVLVTRSADQAGEIVDLLEELGAEVIEAPSIRIAPPEDYGPLDTACASAGTYDWIVFTSANAVDQFMRRFMLTTGDVRALAGVRLCAVGPATADRLSRFWIRVDLIPAEHRAEAVADALRSAGDLAGARVLLPRGDLARETLADELRAAGAEVTEVIAYRTIPESPDSARASEIYRMLLQKEIDIVTFTSASTVRNFVRIIGTEPAADLLANTIVAAIGPVTAEAAERLNIHPTIVPSTYTVAGLVQAIAAHLQGTSKKGFPS